jgi:hypothetical protein
MGFTADFHENPLVFFRVNQACYNLDALLALK